jgi:uroporphyrinogen decarboxylase
MKFSSSAIGLLSLFLASSDVSSITAFQLVSPSGVRSNLYGSSSSCRRGVATPTSESVSGSTTKDGNTKDPLLIRAARGETVERTPVWMMRQAGRHIKEYRDLCKQYPTFRQRSEIPEVAVEVSLQPWRNYQTDGCILFSDILTPLPGMGLEFTIDEKKGPIMEPIRSYEDAKKVRFSVWLFPSLNA